MPKKRMPPGLAAIRESDDLDRPLNGQSRGKGFIGALL